jgi:hypothetical protein
VMFNENPLDPHFAVFGKRLSVSDTASLPPDVSLLPAKHTMGHRSDAKGESSPSNFKLRQLPGRRVAPTALSAGIFP